MALSGLLRGFSFSPRARLFSPSAYAFDIDQGLFRLSVWNTGFLRAHHSQHVMASEQESGASVDWLHAEGAGAKAPQNLGSA